MLKAFFMAATAVLLLVATFENSSAATVGFSPGGDISVTKGNIYSLGVILSELGSGNIVSAFDLDIRYDQSLLQPVSVTLGPWLGDTAKFEVLESTGFSSGIVDIAAVSLLSDGDLLALQAGSGGKLNLASLTFNGIASGPTALGFSWSPGQDIRGANNEVINLSPVPAPATLLLFVSGVAGIAPFVERKRVTKV